MRSDTQFTSPRAKARPACQTARTAACLLGLAGLAVALMVSCASPQVAAMELTPIPTLIPATMVPSQILPAEPARLSQESYPAGVPSAQAGQALYMDLCADCHGVDGNGQVPNARDFGDVDYMRGETPLDFYVAITEGEASFTDAENEMPAFRDVVSSDERWDLVYYVWRFATSAERLSVGREIYTAFCEECHGDDGRSQTLDAADLSDQRFMAGQSPSMLYLSVTRGRGSMPAWQARLSQDERWMVIEYLRAFSYDPQLIVDTVEVPAAAEPTAEAEPSLCPEEILSQANPFPWDDPQVLAVGQPIYQRECSECHGDDGAGSIARAGDFTNPAVRGELLTNPGALLCVVMEGRNRMPDFKDVLSQEEMWQVLSYIASLGAP